MSRGTRLLVILLGAAVAVAAIVGIAIYLQRGWPAAERTAFIDACVSSCRASPGVTPDRYPMCDQACTCGADEAEKMMTARELMEFKTMESDKATPEQADKLEKVKAAGAACAARAGAKK